MKNKLIARIMGNELANKIVSEITKFYIQNEGWLLTGGTIGFSWAATAAALKNAEMINYTLREAREALAMCNTQEERNTVYKLMLKELFPLVAPIVIFEAAATGCALLSKKQYDKKLAEAAGALSIAQAAITQYQAFQKEAQQAIGDEKYEQIQKEFYEKQEYDGRRFVTLPVEGAPGELLFIDKYSGRPFWCHESRIKSATERISLALERDAGDYDGVVTINNWYDEIQHPDLTRTELGDRFGYLSKVEKNGISYRLADTHFIFPNGTRVQAAELYLYPEPDYIG